jgi:cation:H+ antiporter
LRGIAIQTVVLVALDAFGVREDKPLTYRAASLVPVLEAALVVVVLAIVIAGTQLPKSAIALRLTPAVVLIVIVWIIGLLLLQRCHCTCPVNRLTGKERPDGELHQPLHAERDQ